MAQIIPIPIYSGGGSGNPDYLLACAITAELIFISVYLFRLVKFFVKKENIPLWKAVIVGEDGALLSMDLYEFNFYFNVFSILFHAAVVFFSVSELIYIYIL